MFDSGRWRTSLLSAVGVVIGTALLCVLCPFAQEAKEGDVEPTSWRAPSWKAPTGERGPVSASAANTPEGEARMARLRERASSAAARVQPHSTREDLLEAFARVVEEAEAVSLKCTGMAAGKEASEIGAEFRALIAQVAEAKDGVNWCLLVARQYMRIPHYSKARVHLQSALSSETDPRVAPAIQLLIGISYLREKKVSEGVRELRTVVEKFPESTYAPKALHHIGDAHLWEFRYQAALQCYGELIQNYPLYPYADSLARSVEKLSKSRLVSSDGPTVGR